MAGIPAAQFIRERTAADFKMFSDFIMERKLDEDDEYWSPEDRADYSKLADAHDAEWKQKAIDNMKARGAL
uniref:hypothetical protein n=1 Tax=Rhodococcus qingshengii TaxID=334542 RepID=UPI001C4DD9EB|nr:hypothetical protein [Rhodococcus qingshengii]